MRLAPKLQLRQTQSFVLTPQMRQSIELLQLPSVEVAAFVEHQLEQNPLLERAETLAPQPTAAEPLPLRPEKRERTGTALLSGPEPHHPGASPLPPARHTEWPDLPVAAEPPGLLARLGEQLRLSRFTPRERQIGEMLLGAIDSSGRLDTEPGTLARTFGLQTAELEHVRRHMMRFDPVGVFATDLRECLMVQLEDQGRLDDAMTALLDHLDLVARRDLRRLRRICGRTEAQLAEMIADLRALDPHPGRSSEHQPVQTVVPDLSVFRGADGAWMIEIDAHAVPRVMVNSALQTRLSLHGTRADKPYVSQQVRHATWLIKALEQRTQTILRVGHAIMLRQHGFLERGLDALVPLCLRDIAGALDLHESTVSRVTSGKYILTPRGMFELKFFFATAINAADGESFSASSVREAIRRMVANEPGDAALSDEAIVMALRKLGIDIARRTVAKYRDALNIPGSRQRRRNRSTHL